MFEVKALLNDAPVIASASLVISPNSSASLLVGGIIVYFDFSESEGHGFNVRVANDGAKTRVTFENLTAEGGSADIEPFTFSGKNFRISVEVRKIGDQNPHRIMNYTIAEI